MRYRGEAFARCRLLLAACLVYACSVCVMGTAAAAGSGPVREVVPAVAGSGGGLSGAEALASEQARASGHASGGSGSTASAGILAAGAATTSEGGGVLGVGGGGLGDPLGVLLFGSEPLPSGAVTSSAGSPEGPRGTVVGPLTSLDAGGAARVDREAFPAQVVQPAGGPPPLPAGDRIVRFVSDRAAQLALADGMHGVVESSEPMAVESSPGHFAPVDLGLQRSGGVFESARPLVGVLLPARASEGVQLPEVGVSLTPVDAQGGLLGGAEGVVDGASVVYANTQTNADTVVRPTLSGVEASTVLRAADSPSTVYFRVGLPAGARLVQSRAGAGPVQVVEGSRAVAVVRPPGAVDAVGETVPTSMSVNGDLLAVSVSAHDGGYRWPIDVDPEIIHDEAFGQYQCHQKGEGERQSSNWCWSTNSSFKAYWYTHAVEMWNEGPVGAGAYTVMSYKTQGESKIYEVEGYSDGQATKSEAKVEFARKRSVEEGELEVPASQIVRNGYKSFSNNQFCVSSGCPDTAGSNENLVAFKAEAYEPLGETDNIDFSVQNTKVYIAQEHPPTATFNENETEIEVEPGVKRLNALYNAQSERSKDPWLGPYSNTAFQAKAHDPGIGVAWAQVVIGSFRLKEPIYEDGKCNGVQCKEDYSTDITYNPEMEEGEPTIKWWAADLAGKIEGCQECVGLETQGTQIVKVDGRAPTKLEVTGWPARGELSAAPHALTVSARDEGPAGKPSSGVKSVAVSVDGVGESGVSGASCSPGPCTASGTYTLAGEDLSEGVHRLIVTATDNAGNVAAKEYTFDVRHGTPIPVGPGAVDPTTGQLKLSATDVSLAGSGGVSRVFQSRDATAGAGGPLGQQWALSLGGGQGMTVLPTGSVVLASSGGATTTFRRNEKGELESPLGDENIKVEAKEKEPGKGVSEYLLKDAHAGTTTVFTQPVGTEATMPVFANQFGQQGAKLEGPVSAAVDAHGNVWATDYAGDRVLEFSSAGVLLGAYGSPGPYLGNFNEPWGVAVNRSSGNVYVSDPGNNRVVEMGSSGVFVRAFGWGVSPGGTRKEEFQDCTAYCEAGIPGAGAGQFNTPRGVAVDPSGDVWVADYNNKRVEEFNAEGKYLNSYGSAGTSGGQFEGPMQIAFSGSDLFVADQNNNRVQEITSAGAFVEAIGWGVSNGEAKLQTCTSGCRAGIAGSGNGQFNAPEGLAVDPAGDVYVSDINNNRVQELTGAGAFVTKFGSVGSGQGQFSQPSGVAVASSGEVYVTDYGNKRIQEWMRPSWLPSRTEGSLKNVSSAYAYAPVEVEGKVVIEPTEALAATPAGIVCVGSHGEVEPQYLKAGCRALTFNYAESTTAKGEGAGEWGDYKGDLTRVYLQAFDPSSKTMKTTTVAHYLYDTKGRLRAVWDPRIEPELEKCAKEPLAHGCLVTTYGYDEKGRVTAVTPPHQESWALTYGTIPRDGETGRLIKATRAPASAKVWGGGAVGNSEAPKLSGTPVVGVRMAASDGKWSGEPVAYGYQWEDCNAGGGECVAIAGATNPNYTPRSSDVGHTIVAKVTATNGAGSLALAASASAVVASTWQERSASRTQLVDGASSVNAVSCVPNTTECVLGDSKGNAFYASNVSAAGAASWRAWAGPGGSPSEALACPSSSLCLMAAGERSGYGGTLYYATSLGGAWSQAYSPAYGVDAISCVSTSFCVDGQDGSGYFRYSTSPASSSWTLEEQGSATMKGVSCLSSSFCAMVDSKGSVHVATTESQVESSSWTETNVDGSTALNGVSCTGTNICLAVDGAGNVLFLTIAGNGAATVQKENIDGTNTLTAITCVVRSACVTVDNKGNVFVSTAGNEWKKAYTPGGELAAVSCASVSLCVASSKAGTVTSFDPMLTQPVDSASALNAVSCVPNSTDCVVSDGKGNAYYATNVSAESAATWHSWSGPGIGPSEAMDCPSTSLCLMAAGEDSGYGGNLYYSTSFGGSWTQAYSPVYGVDGISCPSSSFCADAQDGGGYFRWSATPASSAWELQDQGSAAMKGIACLSASFCAIADGKGSVHVATTESQVRSSSWTETNVDGSTVLNGVACMSTSSCVAVDNAGNALKLAIAGNGAATISSKQNIDGNGITAVACSGSSTCVVVDGGGNVLITTNAGERWEVEYYLDYALTSVSCSSSSLCATVDTQGRVTAFDPEAKKSGPSYTQSVDGGSGLNAVSCIPASTDCVVSDGNGNAFYATNVSTTATPSWTIWNGPGVGPSEAVDCQSSSLCLMAAGKDNGYGGNLYYTKSLGGSWTQAFSPLYGVDALSCPTSTFCAAGQDGAGNFRWSNAPGSTSWEQQQQGSAAMKAISCLAASFCAIADSTGSVHVATSEAQVKSSSWTETKVDGSTALNGIACTSTSACLAVDAAGNIVNLAVAGNGAATASKQDIDGTNNLDAIACTSNTTCAAVDTKGGVFTEIGGTESWHEQYALGGDLTSVSCASVSLCVTVGSEGNVTAFEIASVPTEASERSPQPGTTIEYGVPVSGEGAPKNLSSEEVEKWGQKDLPKEATAIFPPDEPQGWPASGYKRATVAYIDEQARTVNAVTPTGAIATTEYNEANEVVRTLSPANRAVAMAEGCVSVSKKECKSAEVAEKLDTQTEYNQEDNQILKVLGPEHKVKLSTGAEVQARAVTHSYYNEGAAAVEEKTGEQYNLLTKTVSGARLANGEEKDKRTTITSYSGQNDLGWKLRKPTSTTVDPEGLNVTTTTLYDENTGEVVEARSPGGVPGEYTHSTEYLSQWGTSDPEKHVTEPQSVAVGPEGDIWVADTGDSRVVKLSAIGAFIAAFGSEGSGEGQFKRPGAIAVDTKGDVWVADSNNHRIVELSPEGSFVRAFGSEGTEPGKLKYPHGIAVDSEGHVWVVDSGNNRLQEFTATGELIRVVGAVGTGNGEFRSPYGVAINGEGDLFVADLFNNRIQELSSTGTYMSQFKVASPIGVTTDGRGNLIAAFAGKVGEFSRTGQELASIGSVGSGEGQYESAYGVAVDSSGDVWVADTGEDGAISEFSPTAPALGYISKFGQEGTGEAQFKNPTDVVVDAEDHIWVSDTANNRVQELSWSGSLVRQFGSEGTAEGQFKNPAGIAINKEGDIWVADSGNKRLQEFSPTGSHITQFNTFSTPSGITVDAEGHLWVTEQASDEIREYTSSGEELKHFGGEGTSNGKFKTPAGITVDKEGHLWIADEGNSRIQELSATGEYVTQVAVEKPRGLRFDSTGHIWVAHASGVQEFLPSGEALEGLGTEGTGNGQFKAPWGVALDPEGHLWVADSGNDRIQELGSVVSYSYLRRFPGLSPMQFYSPKGIAVSEAGDVWVADTSNHRIQEVSPSGEYMQATNWTFSRPEGIAIDSSGNVWTTDASKNQVNKFNSTLKGRSSFGSEGTGNGQFKEAAGIALSGANEYVVDRGNNRVQEFNDTTYVRQFGASGSGNGQLSGPQGIAIDPHGNVWVADAGNNRIEEFSAEGAYIATYGTAGSGSGQFSKPEGVASDLEGNIWVADTGNSRVQELSPSGAYMQQFASEGTGTEHLSHPASVAVDSSNHVYVLDTGNNRVQEWKSVNVLHQKGGGGSIKAAQTIYYTPGEEASIQVCRNHPEWANLPCRVQPAAQPADVQEGKPALPVTTMTYNLWDETETSTEEFGTVTRTKTQTYDAAGRALTSEETATQRIGEEVRPYGTPLPKVTNEYNAETGALEKQSATIKGETKATTSKNNTLGHLIEYTDAEGNVTKYTYEEGGDGRLERIEEGKGKEAESYQTYSYDPTTGFMTTLVDSAAKTFTASYDIEGRMVSEVYPNGMCANTTYDAAGEATSLQYIKTRNCAEKEPTVWFSDTIVPSIHGETLEQVSTLAKESYVYDSAGRLAEVQETPSGKGCTARLYAYDEASNRTSLTTREPGLEGKCASEGGTSQQHSYDEANRLVDAGVEYEAFGNTTKLPASDAEHEIKSTYYVDSQVATQEQNNTRDSYFYDPTGRAMETTSENTETKAKTTTVSHYAGAGGTPTWTSEGTEKWSRNIPGLDGTLCAVQTSSTAPVLQLHDLQGNIVATAALSESETKLASTYNSTEFGVPSEGKTPPKYAWLGASGLSTETAFGSGVSTQGGASYVPQVARDLQTAPPVPPGAFPNGQGTGEQYGSEIAGWYISLSGQESAATLAAWTAKQEQLRREAEAACISDPESCITEEGADPAKVWHLNEKEMWAFFYAATGLKVASLADFGADIKELLGIDFIKQVEDYIEKQILGVNRKEVEDWVGRVNKGVENCLYEVYFGPRIWAHNPTCWVWFPTKKYHVRVPLTSITVFEYELPIWKDDPQFAFCPVGESPCYPM